MKVRVGNVNKGLIAVDELVENDHTVVLDKEKSFAKHKPTGSVLEIRRKQRVFETDLEVLPYHVAQVAIQALTTSNSVFPRPAQP